MYIICQSDDLDGSDSFDDFDNSDNTDNFPFPDDCERLNQQ